MNGRMKSASRIGRPPLDDGAARDALVRIRLTAAELDRYRAAAEARGESLSEGVRQALAERYGAAK